jgi:hypothetical protein
VSPDEARDLDLADAADGEGAVPPELAAAVDEQRRAAAALRALGAVSAPQGFAARTLARLADRPQPRRARLLGALFAWHELRLRWSPAAVIGVVALAVAALLLAWPRARTTPAGGVTFVLVAPGARSVTVAGDFNQWQTAAHPLEDRDGDGVWSATLPLDPGRYEYMFVVDGSDWRTDPLARRHRPDGFGRDNAVLEIPDLTSSRSPNGRWPPS